MKWKLRFEPRAYVSPLRSFLVAFASILVALLFSSIIISIQGFNPLRVFTKLFLGGFGTWSILSESILQGIPLMLCGLGVSMALKMSVNNIGAEGQFVIGALCTTGIVLHVGGTSRFIVLAIALCAGFLGGALWGVLAAAPKAFLGVNETIVTLMFNYIALYFVDYWCYGPWRDSSGSNMPYTKIFPEQTHLRTFAGTRIHTGIILAIIAAILVRFFYQKTTRGYQVRVIGSNAKAAHYAGMNIRLNILLIMLFSGGLSGLAGATYVTGVVHRLQPNLAAGAGYTAIIIAYLAKFNPYLVLLVALLFGGLNQGGYSVQVIGVSYRIVTMVQGAILLFVIAGEIFTRYRVRLLSHSYAVCLNNEDVR